MSFLASIVKKIGPLGVYAISSRMTSNVPKILMYHRFSQHERKGYISKKTFIKQLDYISKNFNAITLKDLCECLKSNKKIPRNSIVLTVDDGHEDFYRIAFPLLIERNIPATLFATTGFVNKDLWLWPDKVTWLLSDLTELKTDIQFGSVILRKGVVDGRQKEKYWKEIIDYLLSLNEQKKIERIKQFGAFLDKVLPVIAPQEYSSCSWGQLKEMQASGIEIGAHTVTHPSLGRVERKQARAEIEGSLEALTEHLGKKQRTFCYPNGTPSDYNFFIQDLVKQVGFSCAVTAFHDRLGVKNFFAMRRYPCGDDMYGFYKAVTGLQHISNCIRNTIKADDGE